jgi:phosphoglycerate dehydrogenase-like enzyme
MKILIASPIHRDTIAALETEHDVICAFNAPVAELKRVIPDREVVIFRSGVDINAEVMACAPGLRLLIRAGSGLDNLDLGYVKKHGIQLQRIELPGAKAVAELAFTMMLGLARQIRLADTKLRQGHWLKHELTGHLLTGKTLGIVGAGNIGSLTGRMGVAWGMSVIGCIEHSSDERAAELARQGIHLASFDEVISTADFISLHVPLNSGTRNLIDAETLARMKPGAFLVNLARGGVVDEEALYTALTTGKLAGAGMDVHRQEGEGKVSPLAALDNVILTPHIGAGTVDTQREIGATVMQIIRAQPPAVH